METFKLIPINQLSENPDNPRKTFNEESLQELATSIKNIGILQPILVQKLDDQEYQIICGARRFRAAKLAKMDHVPANMVSLDLTKEQVYEIMITENLQREDVDPIEESEAFEWLKNTGKSVAEIAEKFGRPEAYIRRRLKLSALIPEFKQLVTEGKITLVQAKKISAIEPEVQSDQLYDKVMLAMEDNWYGDPVQNAIDEIQLRLNRVPWDLNDDTLHGGACSNCPKNSACINLLFPEFKDNETCNDQSCYEFKYREHLKHLAKQTNETGFDMVVYDDYDYYLDKIVKSLPENLGEKFYKYKWNKVEVLSKPEPFDPDKHDISHKEDIEQEEKEWTKEVNRALDKKSDYKIVHRINGQDGGLALFRPIDDQERTYSTTSGELTGKEMKVTKLRAKQKRSEELDSQKVFSAVHEAIEESGFVDNVVWGDDLGFLLALKIYHEHIAKWDEKQQFPLDDIKDNLPDLIQNATKEEKQKFVIKTLKKFLIKPYYSVLKSSHLDSPYARIIYHLAEQFIPNKVKEIEDRQSEIAQKRSERIEAKIEDILLTTKDE